MKLFERHTKRVVEICMYLASPDKKRIINEVTADYFCGVIYADDIDYLANKVKDWADDKDCGEYRVAEINGEIYANYD